ncbi:MAG: putative rane-associated protein [Rhodospirillales bacterium]|jgi:hypothetical protein|nr:putative rane-associated protein [Rhodospirillales bacterium]
MRFLVLLACVPLLAGCATIWEGTSQTVQVTTTPVDGARCDLTNGSGNWTVPSTPGSVVIRKNDDELVVECRTADGRRGGAVVPAAINGIVFANIAIGGVIGMGVDFATRAAWVYPQAGPIALAPVREPVVTVTPMASASSAHPMASGAPAQPSAATAPAQPVSLTPPPKVPSTAGEVWSAGQVQYFKLAQQSIESLHDKGLLTDTEYLAKMRLLSERYGPQ